jgi:hypothetical protein
MWLVTLKKKLFKQCLTTVSAGTGLKPGVNEKRLTGFDCGNESAAKICWR